MRTKRFLWTCSGSIALLLTATTATSAIDWSTAVDQLASSNNGTRQLRSLALSREAGNDSVYLGYIQHHTPCSRDVQRHSTIAPPYTLLHTRGLACAQPKGLDTDDRGYVYVGNREGGGSSTAIVHVHDAELNLLDTFNFSTGEFGGIAVHRDGSDYYLYLSREGGGVINRYIATDPGNIVADTTWGTSGSFTVPGSDILRGISVADDGTIFVAQRDPGTVFRISEDLTSVVSTTSTRALDLALWDGQVYVTSYNGVNSMIRVLDMDDLSLIEEITISELDGNPYTRGSSAGFAGIDIDAGGRIWLTDEQYAGSGSNTQDRLLVSTSLLNAGLALNADQSCYSDGVGETVTITIDLTGDGATNIVGGQFFLQYDPSVLDFQSIAPAGGIFDTEIHQNQLAGFIEYAVGVDASGPNSDGTSGDAPMAIITFEALQEVCDLADLVVFDITAFFDTKLSDQFGGEVLPDLTDLHAITIDGTDPTFDTFPSDTTVECDVSMVTIAGTHDVPDANVHPSFGNYRPFMIDTGTLFQPLTGPVTAAGSVDIGSLSNNSSVFFGLIAKPQYDAWIAAAIPGATDPNDTQTGFFGFIDTAYGVANTNSGGRFGLGQQLSFGDTTQATVASGLGSLLSGLSMTFDATDMTGELGIDSATQAYQTGFNYITWFQSGGTANASGNPIVTDWSEGAYAFVGTFFDQLGGAPEINLTFAQSNIADPSVTGEPTASDNCDPSPAITYVDNIIAGACDESFIIERTWTATDSCGNFTSQMQTITVVDTTAPMLVNVPSAVTVPADAGNCDAIITITPPTATDNCDPDPVVTYERSDNALLTLADPFPQGSTIITWYAEDCSGNIEMDTTEVVVLPINEMLVELSLGGTVALPIDRCIIFELTDSSGNVIETVQQTLTFVDDGFGGNVAMAVVDVPCGGYGACLTARDPLHSLRSTGDLAIVGSDYVADGFSALVQGDLNDDGLIDILDFGVYVFQYGTNYGFIDTPCGTPAPHADLTASGIVGTGDFTFIANNFLSMDNVCPIVRSGQRSMARRPMPPAKPRERVSVKELRHMGLGHLAVADLNNDGWVDQYDMAMFFGQGMP